MVEKYGTTTDDKVREFKQLVTKELTPFASEILLDSEYDLLAAKARFVWTHNLGQSCGSLHERRKRPNDRVAQNKRTKEYRRTWTDRSCLWDCMGIGESGSQLESWLFCDKVEY